MQVINLSYDGSLLVCQFYFGLCMELVLHYKGHLILLKATGHEKKKLFSSLI